MFFNLPKLTGFFGNRQQSNARAGVELNIEGMPIHRTGKSRKRHLKFARSSEWLRTNFVNPSHFLEVPDWRNGLISRPGALGRKKACFLVMRGPI